MRRQPGTRARITYSLLNIEAPLNCFLGVTERNHEGITLSLDFIAMMMVDRLAHHRVVQGETLGHRLGSRLPLLGRALHIGEHERYPERQPRTRVSDAPSPSECSELLVRYVLALRRRDTRTTAHGVERQLECQLQHTSVDLDVLILNALEILLESRVGLDQLIESCLALRMVNPARRQGKNHTTFIRHQVGIQIRIR